MKNFILSCILYVVRVGMSIIYFFIKLFPTNQNKITMLSRQSNTINIDFEMILDELNKKNSNIKVKVLCRKIPKRFIERIRYCFYMIRCLYHIATSRVCIIDGYSIPISSLKHKKELIVIQIWHAMGAIKQFGKQVLNKREGSNSLIANTMKMHKNYNYIICVGNESKKIFAKAFGTNEENILTLGMPRIDYLLEKDNKINKKIENFKKSYPIINDKKTILYVPTFRKGESTHIHDVINKIDENKYNLIVKLHPLDDTKIDEKYTVSESYKTFELLKIADYIITDYSAVAFEAAILDKPLFFYLYDFEEYQINRGLNINLKEEMPKSTYNQIDDIISIIEKNEYCFEELKKFRDKYVETIDTNNAKRIVEFILELLEEDMKKENNAFRIKLINIAKKNILLRKIIRKILYIKRLLIYKLNTINIKANDKTVIFFAYKGKSYACSPRAIYEYMLLDEKYKDFNFIWAFKEPNKFKYLEDNKNTKVINYRGKEYHQALASAKYWISNYRVNDHIVPKKEQIYVQCWHGTPLKKLGYDLKNTNNAMNSEAEIHDKYKIDAKKFKYILSPSKFASEKFISAWNLKNTNMTDKVIEEGYPRNDFLYNFKEDDVAKVKKELKLPSDKKIILYAPTWRDDQHKSGVGYVYETQVKFDLLKEKLQDEYIILFRAHYLVANSFDFEKYKGFIYDVSKVDDINNLYIISDVLITDYSSVFFDYANLKKPIIFYMYDFEKYKDSLRGFYIDIEELPGKITKTENELINAIFETKEFNYGEKYKQFNKKYNYLDDGKASKRVIEKIIK